MVLEIIGIMLAVIILSIIINGVEDYCKQSKRVNMSFKEAMDLVELPVVTFLNGDKKLNFLLDTGSNISQINSSILPLLDHKKIEAKDMDVTGIEGNKVNTEFCEMTITYKGQEFVGDSVFTTWMMPLLLLRKSLVCRFMVSLAVCSSKSISMSLTLPH